MNERFRYSHFFSTDVNTMFKKLNTIYGKLEYKISIGERCT